MTTATAEQIVINEMTYDVVRRFTVQDAHEQQMPHLAALMEANGVVAQLCVRRPDGRCVYSLNEYAAPLPRFGSLTKIG